MVLVTYHLHRFKAFHDHGPQDALQCAVLLAVGSRLNSCWASLLDTVLQVAGLVFDAHRGLPNAWQS